ncbi:MAG: hypothetical protein ILA13_04875 [Eubacterium sp.]|nr:hypothetical protein [Eubacterium sp.]
MGPVYYISMFLVALIFCFLCVSLARMFRSDGGKAKYDERQILARGKGYKYAFYAAVFVSFLPIVIPDNIVHFLGSAIYFVPLFVGIMVYISYCIWNDAYLEINLNKKSWIIFMVLIGLFNICLFLSHIKTGYVENGVINISVVNLMTGILCFIVLVELILKYAFDKRGEADDDEEFEA